MKTNKEIKPFKMLLSRNILEKVKKVLAKFSIQIEEMMDMEDEDMLVLIKYPDSSVATLYSGSPFIYYSQPELTYSEFMKLYGEEQEVFTREGMVDIATKILLATGKEIKAEMTGILTGSPSITFSGVDEWITNFLSEQTND